MGYADVLFPDNRVKLTYCVSRASVDFEDPSEYDTVLEAMNTATQDWERVIDVNFIHLPEFDDDCVDYQQGGPAFRVRKRSDPVCGGLAFKPSDLQGGDVSKRVLFLNATNGALNCPTLLGQIRTITHELGHIVGLRHEMVITDDLPDLHVCNAAAEFEEVKFSVSPYDVNSTMMYNQCANGEGNREISRLDARGARTIYAMPRVTDTDFNGDGLADIFFYSSSGSPESNTILFGGENLTIQTTNTPNGAGQRPIAVDLSIDGKDDLLLLSPFEEDVTDQYFRRTDDGQSFEEFLIPEDASPLGIPSVGRFFSELPNGVLWDQLFYFGFNDEPLVAETLSPAGVFGASRFDRFDVFTGDFDANGNDDILYIDTTQSSSFSSDAGKWYFPVEKTWSYIPFNPYSKGVPGLRPFDVAHTSVGDFDGDGASDIVWYVPGEDVIIWFGGSQGPGTNVTTLAPPTLDNKYKLFSHDLLGLGRDQLYWIAQTTTSEFIWVFSTNQVLEGVTNIPPALTNNPAHREMLPIAGNFKDNGQGVGGARAEIYWWNSLGVSKLWVLDGDDTFQVEDAPSGQGFPVGYALR